MPPKLLIYFPPEDVKTSLLPKNLTLTNTHANLELKHKIKLLQLSTRVSLEACLGVYTNSSHRLTKHTQCILQKPRTTPTHPLD